MNTDQVERTDEADWEEALTASLRRHVDEVAPPPVDADALIRRAQQHRGRGVGGGVLAAAAVVALIILVGSLLGGRSDQPADTAAPGLPMVRGGATGPTPVEGPRQLFTAGTKVFMDGRTFEVRVPDSTGAHVSQLGLAYPRPGDGRPMLLRRDGRIVTLGNGLPAGASYQPWAAAESEGPLVAWAYTQGRTSTIVAWDAEANREVAHLQLACRRTFDQLTCPQPYVVSSGVVILDGGDGVEGISAWTPASGRVASLGDVFPNQAHRRVLTTFEDMGTLPRAALPGWQQAHAPKGIEGLLSFDGGWLLDANGNPKVVDWRNPDRSITYRAPGKVTEAQFDTDGSVLLVTAAGKGLSIGWDCRLGGACKRVVPPTANLHLVAWDT